MRNEHGTGFGQRVFAYLMSVMMTAALVPVPALAEALEESRTEEVTTVQEEVVAEFDADDDASVAPMEATDEPQPDQQPEVQQPVDVAQQVDDPTAAMPAFEAQENVDGVRVIVRAGEGAFPEGSTLSVENATADERQQAEEAVDDARDEGRHAATSYTFNIKVLDAEGAELQPAEGHTVEVSFALAEVADNNLTTSVYHLSEDEATGELNAEPLDVATEAAPGADGEAAVVTTDGFSLYTVEFTYGDLCYMLNGDESVPMSEILSAIGLAGDVTAAEVSDSTLFSASDESGAWVVTAHQAFSTTEWMKVTINGVVYEVAVTDDQAYAFRVFVTGGGTVTCGGKSARNGETLDVSAAKGETIAMSIVPDENGVVQYAKYSYVIDTQSLAVRTNNPLTLNGTTATLVVPDDIVDAPFVGRVGTDNLIMEDTNAVVEVAFRSPLEGGADEASAVALQDSAVSDLNGGWYRVTQDIAFDHTLYLHGDTHLILDAGATMSIYVPSATITGVDPNTNNCGISSEYTLAISGEGELSVTVGTLSASYDSGLRNEHDIAICVAAYEQTGGTVWAEGYRGISCEGGYRGIEGNNFTFGGGSLTAIGHGGSPGNHGTGVGAFNRVTIGCSKATDTFEAEGDVCAFFISTQDHLNQTVSVASGQVLIGGPVNNEGEFIDGTSEYTGTFITKADGTKNSQHLRLRLACTNLGGYDFAKGIDDDGEYYKVDSAAALKAISDYVNTFEYDASGMRFKQTADIDMQGWEWIPIGGTSHVPFKGIYDGDQYFILNANSSASSTLFGNLEGTVQNVNLKGCGFSGHYAGGIAASMASDAFIKDCTVLSSDMTGPVDGYLQDGGSIENCYFTQAAYGGEDAGTPVTVCTITQGDGVSEVLGTFRTVGRTAANSYLLGRPGEEIKLTHSQDGYAATYSVNGVEIEGDTFAMPDSDVVVSATFALVLVTYVDEAGEEQTIPSDAVPSYTRLTGKESGVLPGGWYVASGELNYHTGLTFEGDVNLILDDGCQLNATYVGVSPDEYTYGIRVKSAADPSGSNLTIYGSTNQTGKLDALGSDIGIQVRDFSVYGGVVSATGTRLRGLSANGVTIVRGTAQFTGGKAGIDGQSVSITGGNVTAHATSTGDDCAGMLVGNGSLLLGWTNPTNSITASGYRVATDGTMRIADGQCMADKSGHACYMGTIAGPNGKTELAGMTLTPANVNVIAEHGTVVPSEYYVSTGTAVTLTVIPNRGYQLDSLTLTPAGGTETNIMAAKSFTKSSAVGAIDTVKAAFSLIPPTAPTIAKQPVDLSLTYGYTTGNVLTVAVDCPASHRLSYQWYSSRSASNKGGTAIRGATKASYTVPKGKVAGTTEHYYCVVTATRTDNGLAATTASRAAKVSVGKAPLRVTAKPKTITYGAAPANSGVSYSGFVHNETASVLSGTLAYTYSYAKYGDVGSYTITPKGLTSSNYRITFVAGTLTVNKKEVRLNWSTTPLTYNGSPQAPAVTVTGLVNSDAVSATVTGGKTNAGTGYTATASALTGKKAKNYKLPSAKTRKFTIAKAKLTSVASIADQAYTGKAVTPKPAVKSGTATLKLGTDYTLSYKGNVNAGKATVTVTGKGNYAGSKSVTFKIVAPSASLRAQVQTYGWRKAGGLGDVIGVTGKSKRLEALRIELSKGLPVSGGIQYRSHVQTYGWEKGWKANGALSGTTGEGKRLEAVQIRLTGNMAKKYDVYYRVHAQGFGWMGWASNGASAGTAGYAKRLEAIQVVIVPKGSKAPSATYQGVERAYAKAFVSK